MKNIFVLAVLIFSGCGYEAVDNELIGQVKKVAKLTPLVCENYTASDVSLGVMRNGVGSMSSQDLWIFVQTPEQAKILKEANESGALVKITYDVKRLTFCVPDHWVKSVEIVK